MRSKKFVGKEKGKKKMRAKRGGGNKEERKNKM